MPIAPPLALAVSALTAGAQAPGAPGLGPQALFERVEARYVQSPALSLGIQTTITSGSTPTGAAASHWRFKQGGRVLGSIGAVLGRKVERRLVCDGTECRQSGPEQAAEPAWMPPLPAIGGEGMLRLLVRIGAAGPQAALDLHLLSKTIPVAGTVAGFAYGTDDQIDGRPVKVIEYTWSHGPQSVRQKVWIDADRLVIVKREMRDGPMRITETSTDTVFDAEIPGETFSLPVGK